MKLIKCLNILLSGTILLSLSNGAVAAAQLSLKSKVKINGIDRVRIGMTVSDAAKAAGINLLPVSETNNECYYIQPQNGLRNLSMMVVRGRVARIDIQSGSSIKTLSGAGIGDSEALIKSLYAGRIKVSPHEYIRGHYLMFTPIDQIDRAYRLIFETDGRQVIRYRVGQMPEVGYVEGCS